MNKNVLTIAYFTYSILFEILIWGGMGYAVFILGKSAWWFLLSAVLYVINIKPSHVGIGK